MALFLVDVGWCLVRLHRQLRDDAWKLPTAALGHPEHIWVRVCVCSLHVASRIHKLDPQDAVARQAVRLSEVATATAQDEAGGAHASHDASWDHEARALVPELVVELPQGVPSTKGDHVWHAVDILLQQVALQPLHVELDAAAATRVVVEAVLARLCTGLHASLLRTDHRGLDIAFGPHIHERKWGWRDVRPAVHALPVIVKACVAWKSDRKAHTRQAVSAFEASLQISILHRSLPTHWEGLVLGGVPVVHVDGGVVVI
mmetsp:Transcript_35275/g.81909  ORF Transcript_35275/g.81909 Transcript_35275/m.81909 type:complete len:259 (+) Transcript_35275:1655-2431(+)